VRGEYAAIPKDVTGVTPGIDQDDRERLRETWHAVRLAMKQLEHLIGVQGPASRFMREEDEAEREVFG
jgi:hypothetical protein